MSPGPVLVTGSNRSGTTWVGRALCQSDELEYVHEPFNSTNWPRLLDVRLDGHYTYVGASNGARFEPAVARLLDHRFPVRAQLVEVRGPRDAARLGRGWWRSRRRAARGRRTLIKDPIALFAAEWLADTFDASVVVMVRHPAAFASSIKRLRWDFDFEHWLRQDELMARYLAPLRADIEAAARARPDHIGQAILLWRAFYSVVDRWREERPGWELVTYEHLADSPIDGFAHLYRRLGLRWDADVARRVWAFSDDANVKEVQPGELGTVRRDSRAAKATWHHRLTAEEIDRVRVGVADVSGSFYSDEDWEPTPGAAAD